MTPLWPPPPPPMAGSLPKLSDRLRNTGIELIEPLGSLISLLVPPGKPSVGDAGADFDNKGFRFAGGGISQSSTEAAAAPRMQSFLDRENDDKILLWTDADSGLEADSEDGFILALNPKEENP